MRYVQEQPRQTVVYDTVDVLVVGGGPGGLAAAIAAARAGMKTMLIERHGCFGGNMTVAGVESLAWYRHEKTLDTEGIGIEFERRAFQMGAAIPEVQSDSYALDTELFKHVADVLVTEAGVIPLLHCLAVEPIVIDGVVKGVVTESKSGRLAVLAAVVIDGTGDADIAFRAGVPCVMSPIGERQAVTMTFNLSGIDTHQFLSYVAEDPATYGDWGEDWAQQSSEEERRMFSPYLEKQFRQACPAEHWGFGGSWSTITEDGQATYLNLVHRAGIDCTSVADLTTAEIEGRAQVLEVIKAMNSSIPGFEHARLRNYGMAIGTRESRKITGEYTLTGTDVLGEGRFPDAIGIFPEFVDGYGILRLPVTGRYFQIPYRAMVPAQIENLLVVGRAVSGDRTAHAATRNMMCCAVTGQGAGIAAAAAIKQGRTCRTVSLETVRKELDRQQVRYT